MSDNFGIVRQYGNDESKKSFRQVEQTIKNSVTDNSCSKPFKEKKVYTITELFAMSCEALAALPNLDNPTSAPINGYARQPFRLTPPPSATVFTKIPILPYESKSARKKFSQRYVEKENKKYLDSQDQDLADNFESQKAAFIRENFSGGRLAISKRKGLDKQNRVKSAKRALTSKVPYRRQLIYRRDNFTCLACGEKDVVELTLDHIIPLCKGGANTSDNLQTLCEKCNLEKGDRIRDYRIK